MPLGLAFWIIMLILALFSVGLFGGYIGGSYAWGGNFVHFVLMVMLGWKVFGPPLQRGG